MEVKMNYLFVSEYKGENVFKYNFENVIDAERHIVDLIYIQGSKVKKLSNKIIEVKLGADYSMLIIKQERDSKC